MRSPSRILIGIFSILLFFPAASPGVDFGGPIEADTTWSAGGGPIHLTGDIRISEGATLTIEPGVVVHLHGHVITSQWSGFPMGYLIAVGAEFCGSGSSSENIFILPSDHVEFCNFYGVRLLLNGNGGSLRNCYFNTSFYGVMAQGEWEIKNCDFDECGVGIWQQLNFPVSVRNCNFTGCTEGFHFQDLQGFPAIEIRFCNFLDVTQGICVDGSPPSDFIDGLQNYWGDPSGPAHPGNPGGSGVPVGDGVAFDPWLLDPATALSEVPDGFPARGIIPHQNSPNPFNPLTRIAFDLPQAREVELVVYSLSGRQVATLTHGFLEAGHHEVTWRGRDGSGQEVASGTYFYRLGAGHHSETKRMILVK